MITDPIILAEKYPNNFRFKLRSDLTNGFSIYFYYNIYSYDYETQLLTNKMIQPINLDHPDMHLFFKYRRAFKPEFKLLNMIHFEVSGKYSTFFKGFKINNSSWAKLEFTHVDSFLCKGEIHFSTALDMINTCNELSANQININIFFIMVDI